MPVRPTTAMPSSTRSTSSAPASDGCEIVAPERPVDTNEWGEDFWPSEAMLMTVTFEAHNGKPWLTIRTRVESVADRDTMAQQGCIGGWAESLDRLEEHLAHGGRCTATPGTVAGQPPGHQTAPHSR